MPRSNLATRLISAATLIPIVLGILWVDFYGLYALLWAAILALLTSEWNNITSKKEHRGLANLPLWISLLWCVVMNLVGSHALALTLPAIIAVFWWFSGRGWQAFGALYLAIPTSAFLWLASAYGAPALLWLLLIIWATDIGGYVAGKTIGGPKLCPSVSPGKTISGLIGCVIFAMATAACFSLSLHISALPATLIGGALALIAQAGDLFQSHLKRKAGKKDSGTLIPGHGGAWDRLDGLLAAAPILAALIYLHPSIAGWLGW